MSQDIVFKISDVFNHNSESGALTQHDAVRYYIAPYQRGYKWASADMYHPVCVLMTDLFNAKQNQTKEYYLQYITTKQTVLGNGNTVLEVIDGQQRLTTLTILLSVLGEKLDHTAISNDLLSYEVRKTVSDFFNNNIYNNIDKIFEKDWNDFVKDSINNDEQDIYYLFHAIKKIEEMINCKYENERSEIENFEIYVLNNVKIILNNIDGNISCEEIFSNLNSNKVDLTESELIKGLLLTKSARERENIERRISYREIIEVRAVIGRQWDEIAHWVNDEEIKSFFFKNSINVNSLNELLFLFALYEGYRDSDFHEKNTLFYYFDSNIIKKSASQYFNEYKKLRYILNDWFVDNKIYNGLGYLFFLKNTKVSIKDFLDFFEQKKDDVKKEIKKRVKETLDFEIDDLDYKTNQDNIHNLLFAINVFCYDGRFNFYEFCRQNWSLEHIFPQNPDEFKKIKNRILGINDISFVNVLIGKTLSSWENDEPRLKELEYQIENIRDVYKSVKVKLSENQSCSITDDECALLYKLIKTDKLHSIGNMVLLTGAQNSSNGNGMFDDKRINIVNMVKTGSFVPRHTYDVFSKLISDKMTPDLRIWDEADINEHTEYIKKKFRSIKGDI
ncbi:MAG: DUF262 domain-containing protein [Treponema sp.]|jgi:uncharacterized protein with ParB-like and HNH nuclease domain|nr:DUF262 domain-containing protein [Treponema sp.]